MEDEIRVLKGERNRIIIQIKNEVRREVIVEILNMIPVGDEYREIRRKIKDKYLEL